MLSFSLLIPLMPGYAIRFGASTFVAGLVLSAYPLMQVIAASGRPTVVTLTSDISTYLSDGLNAFLIPPVDVDALAAKLRQVLADPEAAEVVASAARRVAKECFDYRATGRVLSETLGQVRERHDSRRPGRRT
ncbi:MAG TPA: glycosyltransferase [Coriobacteriia bacterium]